MPLIKLELQAHQWGFSPKNWCS